jgi:hypothetical protein
MPSGRVVQQSPVDLPGKEYQLISTPARNQAEGAGPAPARPDGLALWLSAHSVMIKDEFGTIKRSTTLLLRHPTGRRWPGLHWRG